jgi:hypothetical protein
VEDYRWRLLRHLLPFLAQYPMSQIDVRLIERFKRDKRAEIVAATAAGTALRDVHGRARQPLSNTSVHTWATAAASVVTTSLLSE